MAKDIIISRERIILSKTEDENYHEHIDQLQNRNGKPIANITVRKTH